jgi:DNA-binding GntR family transcriptional regulator
VDAIRQIRSVRFRQASGGVSTYPMLRVNNLTKLSSSAAVVYERMKDEIVFGVRHPKERLVEVDLVAKFQTNRAAVREALARLELDGLVQRTPNRGAAVRDLKPSEVEHIYDVRICIETAAVQRMKFPVPPLIVDRIVEIQKRHTDAVKKQDRRTIFNANNEFHREIYVQCHNPHLLELIELMASRALLVRFHTYQSEEFLQTVSNEHWQMIDAIKDGDRRRLIELIKVHVPRAKEGYLAAYRERENLEQTA